MRCHRGKILALSAAFACASQCCTMRDQYAEGEMLLRTDADCSSCMMQAAECIAKGQEKYNAGDRMGALKFFEQSLQKVW